MYMIKNSEQVAFWKNSYLRSHCAGRDFMQIVGILENIDTYIVKYWAYFTAREGLLEYCVD